MESLIQRVAELRDQQQRFALEVKTRRAEWEQENAELLETEQTAKAELLEAENELRAAILAQYAAIEALIGGTSMAENTKISWCDHTFNCWVGCSKVSEACKHCYAEGWAKRTGQPNLWQGERRRTSAANWKLPLKWQKEAEASGERARVFCASLADVFEDHPAIQAEWRNDLFKLIAATPNLDWLLLTKRPENAVAYLPWVDPHVFPAGAEPWPNVWIGTTVENQQRADERIPQLLTTPAVVRFLSCEPLLGPIDLAPWLDGDVLPQIHWVIAGGESGPNFRPFDLAWALNLQKQCEAAGVAFHFKQHGGRTPDAGGCLLDGKEYKAYPKAA